MGVPITQKTEIRFKMTQASAKPDDTQRGDSAGIIPSDTSAEWDGAQTEGRACQLNTRVGG